MVPTKPDWQKTFANRSDLYSIFLSLIQHLEHLSQKRQPEGILHFTTVDRREPAGTYRISSGCPAGRRWAAWSCRSPCTGKMVPWWPWGRWNAPAPERAPAHEPPREISHFLWRGEDSASLQVISKHRVDKDSRYYQKFTQEK